MYNVCTAIEYIWQYAYFTYKSSWNDLHFRISVKWNNVVRIQLKRKEYHQRNESKQNCNDTGPVQKLDTKKKKMSNQRYHNANYISETETEKHVELSLVIMLLFVWVCPKIWGQKHS